LLRPELALPLLRLPLFLLRRGGFLPRTGNEGRLGVVLLYGAAQVSRGVAGDKMTVGLLQGVEYAQLFPHALRSVPGDQLPGCQAGDAPPCQLLGQHGIITLTCTRRHHLLALPWEGNTISRPGRV